MRVLIIRALRLTIIARGVSPNPHTFFGFFPSRAFFPPSRFPDEIECPHCVSFFPDFCELRGQTLLSRDRRSFRAKEPVRERFGVGTEM